MILVTGGAGFIGSHVCAALAERGRDFVIVDDLSNSSADVVERLGRITGRKVNFVEADVADRVAMARVLMNTASRPPSTSRVSRPWGSRCKSRSRTTATTSTAR